MKHVNYKDVLPVVINNELVKNVTGRLLIGNADGARNFCMRCFSIGAGGHTPMHAHDWEHEVFVHEGNGEVLMGDTWHAISAGSAVFIPGNTEHQFRNNTEEDLTFICLIPSGPPEL